MGGHSSAPLRGDGDLAWAGCFRTEVNEEVRLGYILKLWFDDILDVRGGRESCIQAMELQWRRQEEKVRWGTDRESELSFRQARPLRYLVGRGNVRVRVTSMETARC